MSENVRFTVRAETLKGLHENATRTLRQFLNLSDYDAVIDRLVRDYDLDAEPHLWDHTGRVIMWEGDVQAEIAS